MRTLRHRVTLSKEEATYLVELLRDDMRTRLDNDDNLRGDYADMNIDIRMKLIAGITRIEIKADPSQLT